MKTTELEQLSRDVAKKCGCEPYRYHVMAAIINQDGKLPPKIWLTDDSAFCFDLMVSERIKPINFEHNVIASIFQENAPKINVIQSYHEYDWDEGLATRVAILEAYLQKVE